MFVCKACPGGTVPTAPTTGGPYIAVVERGECFFEEKVQAVIAAGGYASVIIMNREGPDACNATTTPSVTTEGIPVIFIGREGGYGLFDQAGFDIDRLPGRHRDVRRSHRSRHSRGRGHCRD